MLTNFSIVRIIREIGLTQNHGLNLHDLHPVEMNTRTYLRKDLPEFERDLSEAGHLSRIIFVKNNIQPNGLRAFLEEQTSPVVTFEQDGEHVKPILWLPGKKGPAGYRMEATSHEPVNWDTNFLDRLVKSEAGEVLCLTSVIYENPISPATGEDQNLSPIRRLIRLLGTEKKEILYILFYALLVGFVSLALPLGIQTTVELISGGVFFSSVYLMIALVILGVLIGGALQILQITMVEFLQRRVFTKAALEFAYRIPRLQLESLSEKYTPELVNRFFDVITVQKGLPKLLIDLASAAIQILSGLLLISLYHPFFILFGLLLISTLVAIFFVTGPRGLHSSISESKYKYRVVHWLEELGRAVQSFKLGGSTDLPLRKTDYNVNGYLKHRSVHFNTLRTQFFFIILFKAAVIGGMLIVGTMLVVNREITLGQLVASEIVIILIINSVEKIIMYMDVVYDLLTAVDKIAHVTDLPIERFGGLDVTPRHEKGFALEVRNLSFVPVGGEFSLRNINLSIAPGERICISGPGGSGKTMLTNILAGLYTHYQGSYTLDGYSLRDLDLTHLREKIAKNISVEDLFDGTILENLSVGNAHTSAERVLKALQKVGLADTIHSYPDGLSTHLLSGGKGLPDTVIQKLILARCLAKQPRLMVLNDFFIGLPRSEKLSLIQTIIDPSNPWTLVAVSNDPMMMSACDRVIVLDGGQMIATGSFAELMKDDRIKRIID
ncbi:MAG: ATP-binding cassette domain-containing protein [Cyclobacteriaceae bacterium]|nr:ATP-binding cassette domain-containing protein [Cyclobacteriaceae bacterium]